MNQKATILKDKMEEAVNFLYDIPKFTTKNTPQHTRDFLALLGNPQDAFKAIHVAGSNGKGSVCKFLYEMLLKDGKAAGLFTSPHLVDIRERFHVNGKMCSEEQFLDAYMQVKEAAEQQQEASGAYPTFFEFIFAMGMVLFREAGLDYAVLETGLGGRLDATNTVTSPLLTIITSISLEHTEYLGDTIALVAGEKAGILKPGAPVVYDANEPEAVEVIEARARELGCASYGITKKMCQIDKIKRKFIDFSLSTTYDKNTRWQIPFAAQYQVMNASLAITGARVLSQMGELTLTDEQMQDSIAHTTWQGRMEEVRKEVYFDGAHNVAGITEFVKNVKQLLLDVADSEALAEKAAETKEATLRPLLLFSMVKEKDYHKAVAVLAKEVEWAEVYVATIPSQRGIPAEELQEIFDQENGRKVISIPDYKQALNQVLAEKREGQMVFCTGSLYFIGALKAYLEEM